MSAFLSCSPCMFIRWEITRTTDLQIQIHSMKKLVFNFNLALVLTWGNNDLIDNC